MTETQVQIGELTFNVATAGEAGRPLVLMLHGFPQTSYTWRHQMKPLASAGYFALAPDQRGYSSGARPETVDAYQTDLLVGDALALMTHYGYDQAHIVGHDWGGQLSWLLAGHYPERVTSLTVLSRPHPLAFLQSLADDPEQAGRSGHHQRFQKDDAAADVLKDDAAGLRAGFRKQGVADEDINAYLSVLGTEEAMNAAINWYRAPVQSGGEQPLAPARMPHVRVPTMYIWGDADATVGRMAAEGSAEFVAAEYRFEVLADVGHFVTDQAGERVSDLLIDFLSSVDQS